MFNAFLYAQLFLLYLALHSAESGFLLLLVQAADASCAEESLAGAAVSGIVAFADLRPLPVLATCSVAMLS